MKINISDVKSFIIIILLGIIIMQNTVINSTAAVEDNTSKKMYDSLKADLADEAANRADGDSDIINNYLKGYKMSVSDSTITFTK